MADTRNLELIISTGKTPRKVLRLPQLHFVAVDNWVKVLGKHAFVAWLQLYSWADRVDRDRDCDMIPRTMSDLMREKNLDVSKGTFYQRIIRPLWNYWFIDILEWQWSSEASVCNIIVYTYPANDYERATKELVKLRDYDTEYKSRARSKAINNAPMVSQKLKAFHQEKKASGESKKQTARNRRVNLKNELGLSLKIRLGASLKNRLINYQKDLNAIKSNETTTENYQSLLRRTNPFELAKKFNVVVGQSTMLVQQQTVPDHIQGDTVEELLKDLEEVIGVPLSSISKSISSWVISYGPEYLREKAALIRDNPPREGWTNILGAYTKAVMENWPMPLAKAQPSVNGDQHPRDERYKAFYDLFPER